MTDIPRHVRIDLMTPIELAIREIIIDIEKLPHADPRLTNAQSYLIHAQRQYAAFVDGEEVDHPLKQLTALNERIASAEPQDGSDLVINQDFIRGMQTAALIAEQYADHQTRLANDYNAAAVRAGRPWDADAFLTSRAAHEIFRQITNVSRGCLTELLAKAADQTSRDD